MERPSAHELGPAPGASVLGRLRYELEQLLFGEARIILTDGVNVVHFWVFGSGPAALEAWERWGGDGEPEGFMRSDRVDPRDDP